MSSVEPLRNDVLTHTCIAQKLCFVKMSMELTSKKQETDESEKARNALKSHISDQTSVTFPLVSRGK